MKQNKMESLLVNDVISHKTAPGVIYQIRLVDEVKKTYTCDRLFTGSGGVASKMGQAEISFEKANKEFNIIGGVKRWI